MNQFQAAIADLRDGMKLAPLWSAIGWDQTMARFHRTFLGPFWLSSGLLGMAFALSFVFGGLLGSGDWRSNFEFTIYGVLSWSLLGAPIAEGANAFINGAGMASVQKLPLSFLIALHIFRTLVNYFAQFIVAIVLLLLIGRFHIPSIMIIPGWIMVTVTTFFLSFVVAFPSTRFRDVGHMIGLLSNVLFFTTPVFWHADQMHGARRIVVDYNPLAHELALIRQPLMGLSAHSGDWIWTIGTLGVAVGLTLILLTAFRRRVAFWL